MLSEKKHLHWHPSATIVTLKKRSQILKDLRAFFYQRSVYEVDTPILSTFATADLHIESFKLTANLPSLVQNQIYYCHTSPEYTMKRLLCAGSGDIFYLGKVFRDGDLSTRHQPEFTMLEWYRIGFSLEDLIAETVQLIQSIIGECQVETISYQQVFLTYAGIADIHQASAKVCIDCLNRHKVPEIIGVDLNDKSLWEQLVFTEVIEPRLGWQEQGFQEHGWQESKAKISIIFNYPSKDAALAKISTTNPLVAERFEIFVQGIELANGYNELQEAKTYKERFTINLQQRLKQGKPDIPVDELLIQALEEGGLPECTGVALGVDRLIQLTLNKKNIQEILPFAIQIEFP